MHARPILLRISKFLGKVILGLLLALLILVILIHIPLVQRQLTGILSNYLSSKIESRVEIQRVRFSIWGNVGIEGLEVWDPGKNKIFSARNIEVSSSIPNLISGDFIFDDVQIKGLTGQLVQHQEGLNIQFIIDAFAPTEKQTGPSKEVSLQFKSVLLENVVFEFISRVNGTIVTVDLGKFISHEAEFSTLPNKISANQIYLEHTTVNVLTTHREDTLNTSVIPKNRITIHPDFGTGIVFDVRQLEMKGNDFSFHRNEVKNTPKFDPHHLSIKDIQLVLSGMVMNKDTLAVTLQSLSGQLPGFKVDNVRAAIQMSRDRLVLSDFLLTSNTNKLSANMTGSFHQNSEAEQNSPDVEVAMKGQINPGDLQYFFNDSIIHYVKDWQTTELDLNGYSNGGKGELKTLNMKTRNSLLHVTGKVYDVWDLKKLNWKDLEIHSRVGDDFKKIFAPFLVNIKVPPAIALDLRSAGNTNQMTLDGKVLTTWGIVATKGSVTRTAEDVHMDVDVTGEKVDLGAWLELPWLGAIDLSAKAKGILGSKADMEINGLISSIEIMDQPIHDITLQGSLRKDSLTTTLSIDDPMYRSEIRTGILLSRPLTITNSLQLDSFNVGRLIHLDSTLYVSGDFKSVVKIDQSTIEGYVDGKHVLLENKSVEYSLDTIALRALISPTSSELLYYNDFGKGTVVSNFDIRDTQEVIQSWSKKVVEADELSSRSVGSRSLKFNLGLDNASLFQLMNIHVEDFSSLHIAGELDEQNQTAELQATFGKFKGYGVSLDTFQTNLVTLQDSVSGSIHAKNLVYNSIQLGNLDFDMLSKGDTAVSVLLLSNDTTSILKLGTRILPSDSGVYIYPDKLRLLEYDYFTSRNNPLYIKKGNIVLDQFEISRDNMLIRLDGDLNAFNATLKNVDLTPLNYLLSPDSTVINKGHLTGLVSYSRDTKLNLKANIDSLSLYNSNPLAIALTAVTEGNQVPFDFQLTNASNRIDMKGQYSLDNKEVEAAIVLDVNNLELFAFLVSGIIDDMNGALKGEAKISGPIQKPTFDGHLRFLDVGITTVNPKLTFRVEDDIITLNNSGLLFKDFKVYDPEHHPLTINGNLTTKDYESFAYDLHLNMESYNLIDHADSASGRLRGLLVVDTDIKLVGNERDADVKATITLKDTTNLTFVVANDDIEMLKTEGIIDFIDPQLFLDSVLVVQSEGFYDSLIASLPDFNLNSTITIEEDAVLRVLIDEQSGDYIETSGGANLELGYDRTGNARLSGDYIIKKGVYRLSFYDLVKKNFQLVQGSSIKWSGSPQDGDLDIKAVLIVESNSIGLIGHEIGENEKSIYKRSLDYEVGININGTIEKPIVSFSLDLPQGEKVNYPVLANKLDRLRQPEYESELNKQVFGLLVLGGFLPETSGADINSNLIATTALSNSVNSLLASQLNRFASQYVKGVNIDIGIQSYNDYSAPGGKTQTAMDFRVSKSIMNDRLSIEIGGDFDINQDQSGSNTGTKNFRGDIAIIYDLTGGGDKQLKLFNNETYDIIYQEIRNTGISLIFIREFASRNKQKDKDK